MSEITDNPSDRSKDSQQAAIDMVRARLDGLYDAYEKRSEEPVSPGRGLAESFWRTHHNHPNPHEAWSSYYEHLSAQDKNRLWKEYHLHSGQMSGLSWAPPPTVIETPTNIHLSEAEASKRHSKGHGKKSHRQAPIRMSSAKRFFLSHVKPILSAAIVATLAWFVFYNPLVIARVKLYISPGSVLSSPTIIDPEVTVEPQPRIIIPKINVDVPVVYSVINFDEAAIQEALEMGVVHYGTTAVPGQVGNNVIVGHSSSNIFNAGQFKFAFLQLNKLAIGDTFYLNYDQIRYVYRVTVREIVEQNDFRYVQPTAVPTATLITCDPPGTNWRRLVVQGVQVSPDPAAAVVATASQEFQLSEDAILPGSSPSLWSRMWHAIF